MINLAMLLAGMLLLLGIASSKFSARLGVPVLVLFLSVLMPGDHVFVAMRMNLEPLINRLFEPDPEPIDLQLDLPLSLSAAATSAETTDR
jgi:hypothetical protein